MKTLLLCLPLAIAVCRAETITLLPESCGNGNPASSVECLNVPNNASASIPYINWSGHYRRLLVSLNGQLYDSGLWALPAGSPTSVTIYDASGAPLTVTLSFTFTYLKCSNRYCPSLARLDSGTLVTP